MRNHISKPFIKYNIGLTSKEDPAHFKKRGYRYLFNFSLQVNEKVLVIKSIAKRTKYLKKLSIGDPDQLLLLDSFRHTNQSLSTIACQEQRFISLPETWNSIFSKLLYSYKNLGRLAVVCIQENEKPEDKTLLKALRILKKLDKLHISDRQSVYDNLFLQTPKKFKLLDLALIPINKKDFMNKDFHLPDTEELDVSLMYLGQYNTLLPVKDAEILKKIKKIRFLIMFHTEKLHGDIQSTLEKLPNLESLDCTIRGQDSNRLPSFNLASFINLKSLKAEIFLRNINFTPIPNTITTLNLCFRESSLNFQEFEMFTKQLKRLTNLQEFSLYIFDLRYVNEFLHDLPPNMKSLKKVALKFGDQSLDDAEFNYELNLRLNIFLDWILTLPNLEEVTLLHPLMFCCYCSYLEGFKASPKLRKVVIKETSIFAYDCRFLEGEYTFDDVKTILDILLSSESLTHLELSLHFELFKQNVFDLLGQYLINLKKLSHLDLSLTFNSDSDAILDKIKSFLNALHYTNDHKRVLYRSPSEVGGNFVRVIFENGEIEK